jgi:hypothetical protein
MRRGQLTKVIDDAMQNMPQQFTLHDVAVLVEKATGTTPKLPSVCSYLRRKANSGKIVVINPGAGKRATRYTRIEGDPVKAATG